MRRACKRIGFGIATVLCIFWLSDGEAASATRLVTGRVLTSDGEALSGAVVQIKDTRSLHIRSFITHKDGTFRFSGLNPDIDYEVFAQYRGRSSSSKTVSRFDSSEVVEVDLVIRSGTAAGYFRSHLT
jgi:hypothetical protein